MIYAICYMHGGMNTVISTTHSLDFFASFPDDVLFSRRGRMGRIVSPRHTLPPNTTCTYHFHGYPGDLIWLSFTSYNLQILQQAIHDNNTLGRVS